MRMVSYVSLSKSCRLFKSWMRSVSVKASRLRRLLKFDGSLLNVHLSNVSFLQLPALQGL